MNLEPPTLVEGIHMGHGTMNLEPLYSYQQDNARNLLALLSTNGAACDRSEMGTGKTWTAAVVARRAGFFPVVCCPKTTISNWRNVFDSCGVWQPYLITNYEKLRLGKHPGFYTRNGGWTKERPLLIIFDEAHRLRDRKSQQTRMLINAKKAGHKLLLLSATLIQTPLDIAALGYALGLFPRVSDWFSYARRFGAHLNLRGYYDCSPSSGDLSRLNEVLSSKGVRTRIEDLGYYLPCANSVELVDCPGCPSLEEIYRKVLAEALAGHDERRVKAASLIARGKAREAAEWAKVSFLVQETKDLVALGYSVVVFVNYRAILSDLAAELVDFSPSIITGGQTSCTRDDALGFFQANSTKVLLANIKAGGIGLSLHDTTGNHPRVALISPPESAIDLLQALGRIRRMGMASPGTNRILFASDSVERVVFDKVKTKLNHLATLNDGDLEYEL